MNNEKTPLLGQFEEALFAKDFSRAEQILKEICLMPIEELSIDSDSVQHILQTYVNTIEPIEKTYQTELETISTMVNSLREEQKNAHEQKTIFQAKQDIAQS